MRYDNVEGQQKQNSFNHAYRYYNLGIKDRQKERKTRPRDGARERLFVCLHVLFAQFGDDEEEASGGGVVAKHGRHDGKPAC